MSARRDRLPRSCISPVLDSYLRRAQPACAESQSNSQEEQLRKPVSNAWSGSFLRRRSKSMRAGKEHAFPLKPKEQHTGTRFLRNASPCKRTRKLVRDSSHLMSERIAHRGGRGAGGVEAAFEPRRKKEAGKRGTSLVLCMEARDGRSDERRFSTPGRNAVSSQFTRL
jgi:hypothetical protein